MLCSGIGLIILAPVLLLIMLVILLDSPGPIFFRQQRVGQYQRRFWIHKFRTMTHAAPGLKITVGRDPRITRVGQWLRKSKLDELPQLFDVLRGKMSLVGPRPEVPEYVKYYPDEIKGIIFRVKPGITDWASIKMIDESAILAQAVNPEQAYVEQILPLKLAAAVKYVATRTLWLDSYLIVVTLAKIFRR